MMVGCTLLRKVRDTGHDASREEWNFGAELEEDLVLRQTGEQCFDFDHREFDNRASVYRLAVDTLFFIDSVSGTGDSLVPDQLLY